MWSYQAADEPMLIVGYHSASGRSGSTRRHTAEVLLGRLRPAQPPCPAMWWWTIAAPASKHAERIGDHLVLADRDVRVLGLRRRPVDGDLDDHGMIGHGPCLAPARVTLSLRSAPDGVHAEQLAAIAATPTAGSVVMLNLVKYRQPDGRAEYLAYSRGFIPLLKRCGGTDPVGRSTSPAWRLGDDASTTGTTRCSCRYPDRQAFVDVMTSDEYAAINPHPPRRPVRHVILPVSETVLQVRPLTCHLGPPVTR
jgi:hypothetical protein